MTPQQFIVIQEYLLSAFWPFIAWWLIAFIAASVLAAVLLIFLVVSRELLTRAV